MPPATRYDISCDTGSSTDKDAESSYFDQIIAMSQGIINASFRELYQNVEGVSDMYHDARLLGRIEATLDAPTVMINGSSDNASEIFYQLRIQSGTATFLDGKCLTLANWVLSVRTFLDTVSLEILPSDSQGMRQKKQEWMADVKNSYPGFRPEDYRVQRVFAALGSAGWNTPDSVASTCWDETSKSTISIAKWGAMPENKIYLDPLLSLIGAWAKAQESEKTSTMGIRFSLPVDKVPKLNPTFRPVYIHSQVYPYVDPKNNNSAGLAVGDYSRRDATHPYGYLCPADYNCLLYCENVDRATKEQHLVGGVIARQLPKNRKIRHNGNLAEPGAPGQPDIYGSYVMDHRVFLTTFLLPQLQELCLSTYTQIGVPEHWCAVDTRTQTFLPTYAIGTELKGSTARSASDPWFTLERKANSFYEWAKSSSNSDLDKPTAYYPSDAPTVLQGYSTHQITADSSVQVKWTPGDSQLKVTGKVVYKYWLRFAQDIAITQGIHEKKYTCTATWSIGIVLDDPKDGVMAPRVTGIDNENGPLDTATNLQIEKLDGVVGSTDTVIKASLQSALKRGIGVIIKNIRDRFQNAGGFVYPGHGELEYKDPKFTQLGNIIATVQYRKPTGPDGSMSFPKITRPVPPIVGPSKPTPGTKKFSESLMHIGEPALVWSTDFEYNYKLKTGRLTLQASNNSSSSSDPIQFKYITVTLSPMPEGEENAGHRLFAGDKWSQVKSSELQVALDSGQYRPTPSSTATDASQVKQEPITEKGGIFSFERTWKSGDQDVKFEVRQLLNSLDATITPAWPPGVGVGEEPPQFFTIPRNTTFIIELVGLVPALGQYAIKVHESWQKPRVVDSKRNFFAVDFKMVELKKGKKEGIDVDAWDVSDRLAAEAAAAAAAGKQS